MVCLKGFIAEFSGSGELSDCSKVCIGALSDSEGLSRRKSADSFLRKYDLYNKYDMCRLFVLYGLCSSIYLWVLTNLEVDLTCGDWDVLVWLLSGCDLFVVDGVFVSPLDFEAFLKNLILKYI